MKNFKVSSTFLLSPLEFKNEFENFTFLILLPLLLSTADFFLFSSQIPKESFFFKNLSYRLRGTYYYFILLHEENVLLFLNNEHN